MGGACQGHTGQQGRDDCSAWSSVLPSPPFQRPHWERGDCTQAPSPHSSQLTYSSHYPQNSTCPISGEAHHLVPRIPISQLPTGLPASPALRPILQTGLKDPIFLLLKPRTPMPVLPHGQQGSHLAHLAPASGPLHRLLDLPEGSSPELPQLGLSSDAPLREDFSNHHSASCLLLPPLLTLPCLFPPPIYTCPASLVYCCSQEAVSRTQACGQALDAPCPRAGPFAT